jgi:hypothetical protein
LSREPPTNLRELYAKMGKYARSDADHKKRVEMRKMMRQNSQPGWHNPNHHNPRPQTHNTSSQFNLNKRMSPKASSPSSPHHQPNKAQPSINPRIEEGNPIEPEEEAEAGAVPRTSASKQQQPQQTQQVLLSLT